MTGVVYPSVEQKKAELLDNYGIEITPEMDKEMNEMCGLSRGIAEENSVRSAIDKPRVFAGAL